MINSYIVRTKALKKEKKLPIRDAGGVKKFNTYYERITERRFNNEN